jgi:hypothetical protein
MLCFVVVRWLLQIAKCCKRKAGKMMKGVTALFVVSIAEAVFAVGASVVAAGLRFNY